MASDIALQFRPARFDSPVNQLAQVLQIRGMQDEQSMNQLKMDEYRRGVADQDAMRAALSQPDADPYKVLLQRGNVKGAMDWQKGQQELATSRVDADAKAVKTAHERINGWGQAMGYVRQNPTPENAVAAVQHLVTMGLMPPERAQAAMASVASNPTPQNIAMWADQGFRAALSAKEQLPKIQTSDIGGQTVTQAIDPLTGRPTITGAMQNTQSPNNAATVGAQYAIAQSNRDAANTNAQAVRDAAQIRRDQDTEMKLADDYRAQSKPFKEVSDAHKTIKTALRTATTSPAATLAGATKFMKLLDPGSVVRESELGMALAATGVFDRAAWYFNTLKNGKTLNPKQAEDFANIADQIFQAAQQQQQMIDRDYTVKAEQYKLRPGMIVQDLGQNAKLPASAPNIDALLEKYK